MSGIAERKARAVLIVLAISWVAVAALGPLIGAHGFGLGELVEENGTLSTILWQIRVPRVLLALLGGGILAASGLAFQSLFQNPLAEPYTLGVAGGAALGAVVALQFGGSTAGWGLPLVAVAAFLGALAVSAVISGLAVSPMGINTSTLLLAGIAISLTCSALILLIQYVSDLTRTFHMVRWMMGGLAVVGYQEVLWLAPWWLIGGAMLMGLRWELNLLLTGEELAASRGLNLVRLRLTVLTATSLMVGSLVAVTGPIGFVGLIVPHLLRRLTTEDHLYLLPACLLGGGVFLALCDLVARTVLAPAELPVGVLTALLGGPFFLWLLVAQRR